MPPQHATPAFWHHPSDDTDDLRASATTACQLPHPLARPPPSPQSTLGGASSGVAALRVVDTDGTAHELSEATTPGAMRAARLALGMCGVVTRVTMPVVPQFHLRRRRWRVAGAAAFLEGGLAPLKAEHERFHYYIHPASGGWVKGGPPPSFPCKVPAVAVRVPARLAACQPA